MPQYKYNCKKCGDFSTIVLYEDRNDVVCPKCGGEVTLLLGSPQDCSVTETPDKYKNKRVKRNVTEILQKRNVDHTRKHELGGLIEKHGIENIKKTSFWKGRKK